MIFLLRLVPPLKISLGKGDMGQVKSQTVCIPLKSSGFV
jgi:hypothetical protein